MGAVLDMCEDMEAYTLSDDATYYSRVDVGIIPSLNITSSGDPALKNQYSMILVNSTMWPHINKTIAMDFLEWITSNEGQNVIKSYVKYGQQLFVPNAPGYTSSSLSVIGFQSADGMTVSNPKAFKVPRPVPVSPESCTASEGNAQWRSDWSTT